MIISFKGYDDNGGLHTNHMNENQPNRAYFHRFGYRIDYSLAKSAKFNTIWLKNIWNIHIFVVSLHHPQSMYYGRNNRKKG